MDPLGRWTFGHAVVKPVKEFEVESYKSAFDDMETTPTYKNSTFANTRKGVVQ